MMYKTVCIWLFFIFIVLLAVSVFSESFSEEGVSGKDIQTYVISLARRKDRREHLQKVLPKKLNNNFIIYDAIEIPKKSWHYVEKSGGLSRGKMGCSLSHREIWKRSVERDEPVFILEDDIIFTDDFDYQDIELLLENRDEWEIAFLGHCYETKSEVNVIGKFYKSSQPRCRHGYVVSPTGAEKLLKYTNLEAVGDEKIGSIVKEGKIKSLSLFPPSIKQTFDDPNVNTLASDVDMNNKGNQ